MTEKKRALPFPLVLTLLGYAGCGGPAGTGPSPDMGSAAVQPKFSSLYGDYFKNCQGCHTPMAPGRTDLTEKTLDFSTQATAYSKLTTGKAMGLQGIQAGCNGVPFVQATPDKSLVVAALDQPTRQTFDVTGSPDCNANTISDMTVKVGSAPSADFVAALKKWIQAGAQNN